jgi:hypothetical protein
MINHNVIPAEAGIYLENFFIPSSRLKNSGFPLKFIPPLAGRE